ncbi:MAG: TSCPD domain-containing protein [Desulforhopalus sp.]
MKERVVDFNNSDEDTCMRHWTFTLQENSGQTVIKSIEIKPSGEGCVGHPKTIMALIRDTSIDALDLEGLSATKCVRTTSCRMNFWLSNGWPRIFQR